MKPPRKTWRERLGLHRHDFHEQREVVKRSRSAAWRVPIALIVATVGAGALGYLGVQLFLLPETLAEINLRRVPDLVGMAIGDASREAEIQGYAVVASGRQYSEDVEAGDVIYQIPPPGSYLAKGDTLFALVSLGSPVTRLPDLAGLDLDATRAILGRLGVDVAGVRREASELHPQNVVISSDPPAGTEITEDLSVVLNLSRGGTMVDMPDVRGLPVAAARDSLEIFGLTVGEVTGVSVADTAVGEGRQIVVTGQDPGPRHRIRSGSAVRLQLGPSTAEAPAGRPRPAAQMPSDAAAEETPQNERARGLPDPDANAPPPADEPPAADVPAADDEPF
jgi:beta-lactam-binding protein with PASTA domain